MAPSHTEEGPRFYSQVLVIFLEGIKNLTDISAQ